MGYIINKWKFCTVAGLILLFFSVPMPGHASQWQMYYDIGVFAFEDKAYDTAKKNFLKALKTNPNNEYINQYLGRIYLATGEYNTARKTLGKAHETNPEIPGLVFELAMANFKIHAYPEAYKLFKTLNTDREANPLVSYYIGMSLFKQDEYTKALPYLLSASDMNPSIKSSGFYYAGICYNALENETLARQKFNFVIDNATSNFLIENAKKQLAYMDQKKAMAKPWLIQSQVSYGYDNNVTLAAVDSDVFSNQGDTFQEFFLSGSYHLINQGPHRLGLEFNRYQAWYDDLDQYNRTGTALGLYGFKYFSSAALGIHYSSALYEIDSKDYLTQDTIGVQMIVGSGKVLLSRFSYDYSKNDYDVYPDKNGHTHKIGADVFYTPIQGKTEFSAGTCFDDTSASNLDNHFKKFKTKIGITVKAPLKININLKGNYQIKNYNNTDSFYGIKREDKRFSGSITFAREIFYSWLNLSAELLCEKNNSNIGFFEYKRTVSTLSLGVNF